MLRRALLMGAAAAAPPPAGDPWDDLEAELLAHGQPFAMGTDLRPAAGNVWTDTARTTAAGYGDPVRSWRWATDGADIYAVADNLPIGNNPPTLRDGGNGRAYLEFPAATVCGLNVPFTLTGAASPGQVHEFGCAYEPAARDFMFISLRAQPVNWWGAGATSASGHAEGAGYTRTGRLQFDNAASIGPGDPPQNTPPTRGGFYTAAQAATRVTAEMFLITENIAPRIGSYHTGTDFLSVGDIYGQFFARGQFSGARLTAVDAALAAIRNA